MRRLTTLMTAWLLGTGGGTVLAREEFPLPPDVGDPGPSAEMVLGAQPTRAQGYTTRLSPDGVRGFYRGALPKAGWTLAQLPWMEQLAKGQDAMERFMKEQPEKAREPEARRQIQRAQEAYRAVGQQMDRVIYAVRGAERVLVMVEPGGQGSEVLIQRWEDAAGRGLLGEGPGGLPQPGAPATWPASNPCCDGSAVPLHLRKVPQSVPPYPNGRMIAASALPGPTGGAAMSELYLSEDSAEQALGFYREHMAYNGWTPDETASPQEPAGAQTDGITSSMLSFRNGQAVCSVIVTRYAEGASPFDLTHLPPEARPQLPPEVERMMGPERTLISVTYLELDPSLLPRGAR